MARREGNMIGRRGERWGGVEGKAENASGEGVVADGRWSWACESGGGGRGCCCCCCVSFGGLRREGGEVKGSGVGIMTCARVKF